MKFFNLDLSESVFTVFSQGGLILTFIVMLCRRWRRTESHLLGKLWATGFFIWIHVLLLGNALPLIYPGLLFPTRAFFDLSRFGRAWEAQPWEALAMSGLYGLVTLLLIFVLVSLVTPSPERQLRGWRRARKYGQSSLPSFGEAATSFWSVLIMALTGGAAWFLFTRALVESRWFPGHYVSYTVLAYFIAVTLTAGVAFQAILEAWGARAIAFVTILVGIVPAMIGTILGLVSNRLLPIATWFTGLSPATTPFYASGTLLSIAELPDQVARAIPRAFYFWLFVSLLVTIWLILRLRNIRRTMAASVLAAPAPTE